MAKRTIIWAELAIQQRRKIFRYWNERNGSSEYSIRLLSKIQFRLSILACYPEIGKNTNYPDVKALIIEKYSLFFTFTSTHIEVVSFWDNRQNPSELFQKLITKP
jgi:plasmid stabilization system protein ParE